MDNLLNILPYFLVSLIMAFILTPIIQSFGLRHNIIAKENKRTVHHGRITRIGGLAIYLAITWVILIMTPLDKGTISILIGGTIVFLGGFLDDMYNLKPLAKLAFIMLGSLVPILFGDVLLQSINLLGQRINIEAFDVLVSFCWIVGLSNAINLIDGLDGLASGISFIIVITFCIIGSFSGHIHTTIIAAIVAGALLGFLPFNFHPAKIFLGDCGALYLGYMIACLSLLGFKTSTFISLGFPIIIVFVPLEDTVLAIIRRKLKGQSVTTADRQHLHHIIMYKLGVSHENTVLILYLVTALFSIAAIVLYFSVFWGLIMIFILCLIVWIFIELTGMVSVNFHPLIGLCRRLTGHPKKSDTALFEANKIKHRP